MVAKEQNQIDPEFRKLYPNLTDEQLMEAQENFDRYIEHAVKMFERIRKDPEEYARFMLLVEEHWWATA